MARARPTQTEQPAPKLKDLFDATLVRELGKRIAAVEPSFDRAGFVRASLDGLDALELMPRAWHVAEAMQRYLPQPFPRAAKVLIASLGPELDSTETFGLSPLSYMPHVFFVQKYGIDHFEPSMQAQYELTKRFSAEFSIRAYITKYPEATYARLVEWTRDPSPHVRRLASEGSRPLLPWAPRLRAYQADPSPVIALLELLKDDPVRYVQRSVANNLNDIGKDHPELAIEVCRRWLEEQTPGREWIVKHALRVLVKKGHRDALALMGVGEAPRVELSGAKFEKKSVRIGEKQTFSFVLSNTAKREQELLVDFAVHFVKSNGSTAPKVFKLTRLTLGAGDSATLKASVSFKPMTTRKSYPGKHRVEALVNGVAYALGEFGVKA